MSEFSINTIHPLTAAYLQAWRYSHNMRLKHGVASDNYWETRGPRDALLEAHVGCNHPDGEYCAVVTVLALRDLLDALTPTMDAYYRILVEASCNAA